MRIGEVAERSGLSTKTLRYYETIGLLAPPPRSAAGYRLYDETVLDRLAFVRAAQAVGLSLGEIRGAITFRDGGDRPCRYVLDLLRARSADLDRRIAELRTLRRELRRLVERAEGLDPSECDARRICHVIAPSG